jgi:hypothetical protein
LVVEGLFTKLGLAGFIGMDVKEKTVNRDELYDQIWRQPVSRLAPKYGISDVGLKKVCRKLKIPTPPPGYWTRIRHGYKVKPKPLPKLNYAELSSYTIQIKANNKEQEIGKEASDLVKREIQRPKKITVPQRLINPHPLVSQTRDVLAKATPDEYGALRPWRNKYLNIRISRDSLTRALKIMDALIKAFESRGFQVWNETNKLPNTYVQIFGEKLEISLAEKFSRIDHVPTEKEKKQKEKHPSLSYYPRWDYTPTGKLSLSMDVWCTHGIRKNWSDGFTRKVESMLNDFIIGAIKVAGIKKQWRLEREAEERKWQEEQRKREEEARQREAEEQRLRDLEDQAELWAKSNQLREYIRTVEKAATAKQCSRQFQEKAEKWLAWARRHADQLDPLHTGLPFKKEAQDSGC